MAATHDCAASITVIRSADRYVACRTPRHRWCTRPAHWSAATRRRGRSRRNTAHHRAAAPCAAECGPGRWHGGRVALVVNFSSDLFADSMVFPQVVMMSEVTQNAPTCATAMSQDRNACSRVIPTWIRERRGWRAVPRRPRCPMISCDQSPNTSVERFVPLPRVPLFGRLSLTNAGQPPRAPGSSGSARTDSRPDPLDVSVG